MTQMKKNEEIKAVFFDFDWVLTLNKKWSLQTCKEIANITWWSYEKIVAAYQPIWLDLLLWERFSQIRDSFCVRAEIDLDISYLDGVFCATPRNDDVFGVAKEIKQLWYIIWIITDNPLDRMEVLIKKWKLDTLFDVICVSSQIWWTKHDALIFEKSFESAWVSADQSIFIDNSPKNLIVPEAMWCHVYHHDDDKNEIKLLKWFLHKHNIL